MGVFTMRSLTLNLLVPAMALGACVAALAQTPTYNLGSTPSEAEIRAWDIAVGPAGKELPPGKGTSKEGADVYAQKCAMCHGTPGSEQRYVGKGGGVANWPFATSIWDYLNRAMPLHQEGTLSANEVYAVTAFLLHQKDIIQESDVLDAESLPKVQMPNRNRYIPPPISDWKPGMPRPFRIEP